MSKNILNIKTIKKYVATRKIEWTKHCLNRIQQRNISSIDIKIGINNEKIYIITAYRPDKDRWDEDMKTRRRK